MKSRHDTTTTIAVIASCFTAFQTWRTELLVEGPSSRFVYVDPLDLKSHRKTKFDAIILLPCAYEHELDDLKEACEKIKNKQFRPAVFTRGNHLESSR